VNRIPQRLIDDRRMFAGMGLSLVNNLAPIGPVLQDLVERAAREWLAADAATRSARPRFAVDTASFEFVLQQPDRAEFGITAEDGANGFFTVDDDKLAIPHPVSERRYPAHPHPLLLRAHIKLARHNAIYAEGTPCETVIKRDEDAVDFAEYFRQDGLPTSQEAACAPLLSFNGGRSEIRSRFRSAISPWIDRRQKLDIIRDELEERGIALSRQPELGAVIGVCPPV